MDMMTIGAGGGDLALPPTGPASGPGVPESRDVEEFIRVYNPESAAASPDGVPAPGLGESLLGKLESFGHSHGQKVAALQRSMDRFASGGMSVKDMLDVQMKLSDLTLSETYALKLGEKGSEGVKTLFTNQ